MPQGVVAGVVGLAAPGLGARPAVVEDQAGAVVDEPQAAGGDQQVGVAPGAVDVADQGVEPEHPGGGVGVHLEAQRVEVQRPGHVRHAEVGAPAGPHLVLDLHLGLAAGEHRVEVDQGEFGHRQAEPAAEFAGQHLGDQRLAALGRADPFQDVQPAVVGLDQAWHRTAFAQRRHVADGRHLGEHPDSLSVSSGCTLRYPVRVWRAVVLATSRTRHTDSQRRG
ncbi:hypothetical protein KCH_68680 [Kitasatospora cheerisanensis KCTC 2395]|uniref:Uncharacterized protein n=1 Tax=Kitasatospora cheerisanensis KCTC 2395 TaxID=1348663 RepID=A0A066YTK1_9ACTN|nr:hypothetical protein KCH_68680 [Kitasatospora cheerisanensis KCTC 2395]